MPIKPYKPKTEGKVRKAKTKGTRDRMPRATTTMPSMPKTKSVMDRLKDYMTSDKEKARKAMAKQSTKKSTWT